jgi:hypothetical protein
VTEDGRRNGRGRRTQKKRRRRQTVPSDGEHESPTWPWSGGGGGGVAAVMLFLLILAVVASPFSPVKWMAVYMLIMMPVSTVIFFMAMILSSVLVGAMEIGELHVAFVKAFAVVFVVNLISLMPCVGIY